jgi:hypothetical protein
LCDSSSDLRKKNSVFGKADLEKSDGNSFIYYIFISHTYIFHENLKS